MTQRYASLIGLPLLAGVWFSFAQAGLADPAPIRAPVRPADLTTTPAPPVPAPPVAKVPSETTGTVTKSVPIAPLPAPARPSASPSSASSSPASSAETKAPSKAPMQKPATPAPSQQAPTQTQTPTIPATSFSWSESVAIQSSLVWLGFYDGRADGVLGTGSQTSVANWQQSVGLAASGTLSEAQAKQLIHAAEAGRSSVGMERVSDDATGIRIDLPLGLVAFDRYAPPFVQYSPTNGSGVTAMLISRSGDRSALAGLYNVLQGMPLFRGDGDRKLDLYNFVLTAKNDSTHSYAQAAVAGGRITGFTLSWPAADDARMAKVLATMKATFAAPGDKVLDPGLGATLSIPRSDLTSGLTPDRAAFWRSGMYITPEGAVLTAAERLNTCTRVTIGTAPAHIAYSDTSLAVLTPDSPITPRDMARMSPSLPAPDSEIIVAGFPYPRAMTAPSVTFGTAGALANGRIGLSIPMHDGAIGGPVLDRKGGVTAIVLPPTPEDSDTGSHGTSLLHVASTLSGAGFAPEVTESDTVLPDAELSRRATDMTVRIGCWN